MQILTNTLLEVLERRDLLPRDYSAALLVGSTARGWDNQKSDVDIYIVCSESWNSDTCASVKLPLNPPEVQTESFYDSGRRWEITYLLDDHFRQMLAKVSWAEFRREGVVAEEALTTREETYLARLATNVVLAGSEWAAEHHAQLETSAFRPFLMARSLVAADDCVEDALGQMDSGDLESAVLSARKALGHAVDALLEGHGEYGSPQPKWRPHRFREARPTMLSFDRYWSIETMRSFDSANPGRWVKEVLMLCQDISMKVQV